MQVRKGCTAILISKVKSCVMNNILAALLVFSGHSSAFQNARVQPFRFTTALNEAPAKIDGRISIPSTELDESLGLTQDERTIVNIHRACSPSVVYITSVLKTPTLHSQYTNKNEQKLPRGNTLGSGSGFVIDTSSSYYIITNYHVVQRAYETNQMVKEYDTFFTNLGKNVTKVWGGAEGIVNRTLNSILSGASKDNSSQSAQVLVRFGADENNSNPENKQFFQCEIVDVVKELDVAVLRIDRSTIKGNIGVENLPNVRELRYGQSSDLLVGQTLLAIGNPFGLDRTITSGIVSALGRSVTGVAGEYIIYHDMFSIATTSV